MTSNNFVELYLAKFQAFIEANESLDSILTPLAEKTKLKKVYIALAGAVFVLAGLASGHLGQLLCTLIGVTYPAYASIKAIGKAYTLQTYVSKYS